MRHPVHASIAARPAQCIAEVIIAFPWPALAARGRSVAPTALAKHTGGARKSQPAHEPGWLVDESNAANQSAAMCFKTSRESIRVSRHQYLIEQP
jgi:hypothetical protein